MMRTLNGQCAYQYYTLWMTQQHRSVVPVETFMASKYFVTFIEFAKFVKLTDMPKPETYIKLMINKKYIPSMWAGVDAYESYLHYLDRALSPLQQAASSINTLLDIADDHNIDISKIFSVLTPSKIVHLLHVRKLSPWLLVFSRKYLNVYNTIALPHEKIQLENLIRPSYLASNFDKHKGDIDNIRSLISEMGI